MIILIAPTTLAAAFQLRTSDNGPYAAIASVALITAAMVQLAALAVAAHYTSEVMAKETAVLDTHKLDKEVEKYDKAQASKVAAWREQTKLSTIPCCMLSVYLFGSGCFWVSAYLLLFVKAKCFEEFNLATHEVSEVMCWGCERAIVKPLGVIALLLLFIGIGSWNGFNAYVKYTRMPYVSAASSHNDV